MTATPAKPAAAPKMQEFEAVQVQWDDSGGLLTIQVCERLRPDKAYTAQMVLRDFQARLLGEALIAAAKQIPFGMKGIKKVYSVEIHATLCDTESL